MKTNNPIHITHIQKKYNNNGKMEKKKREEYSRIHYIFDIPP